MIYLIFILVISAAIVGWQISHYRRRLTKNTRDTLSLDMKREIERDLAASRRAARRFKEILETKRHRPE